MKTPRKHAELIKAWADGATIEYYNDNSKNWLTTKSPTWGENNSYRIKPEPKPDIVRFARATFRLYNLNDVADILNNEKQTKTYWTISKNSGDNLKALFDGETGEFKSVERV